MKKRIKADFILSLIFGIGWDKEDKLLFIMLGPLAIGIDCSKPKTKKEGL